MITLEQFINFVYADYDKLSKEQIIKALKPKGGSMKNPINLRNQVYKLYKIESGLDNYHGVRYPKGSTLFWLNALKSAMADPIIC